MFLFMMPNICNAVAWITFSPIALIV